MNNKKNAIKHTRTQSYFIEAAKKLILEEGAQNVTVRKIADLAGYSYGSIYNYYADLDELMFETRNAMIYDMMHMMGGNQNAEQGTLESVKAINRKLAEYFMDNPNVYHFFYSFPIRKSGKTPMDDAGFNEMRMQAYQIFADRGIIKQEEIPAVFGAIVYSLYGLLTLYFSSYGMKREDALLQLDNIVEFILKER
ncbi:MAG: TetR/AcrR family transcriptional regulator [Clostridia bacterium]|nr:TetR/AcrR family transcriptional regulator [Clostridia bacterium]